MSRFNLKYCTLTIEDGDDNSLEVHIGDGTMTWDEKRNIEYKLDRGKLDDVLQGDDVPLEVKFDFKWDFLKSDSGDPVSPREALKKIGAAVDWVSTDDDNCRPYAVTLVLTYDPPCTDDKMEVYTFPDFRWEDLSQDTKAAQISVTGKCNVTEATITRVENASAGQF